MAQNTISQLERGERKAMPSTVRKLADALGVDPLVLMVESRIDEYVPREQQAVEQKAVSRLTSEDRETQRHLEAVAQEMKTMRELEGALSKERARARKEWYESGRWAEYYVSGEYEKWARAFAEARDMSFRLFNKESVFSKKSGTLVDFVSNPEELYLQDIRTALRSYTGDLVAVRSRLFSNDPGETLHAAQLVFDRAKKIVKEHEGYLRSFRRIPDRYYTDPPAHSRILKIEEALLKQRVAAAEDVQKLMDLYGESLDALEDQIIEMREEGDVLEAFVRQAQQ